MLFSAIYELQWWSRFSKVIGIKASVKERVPKSLSLCEKAVTKDENHRENARGKDLNIVLIGNRDFTGKASVCSILLNPTVI